MNLSFAERLKEADRKIWRTPKPRQSSIRKVETEEKETTEKHWNFKKNHSDLKMMLRQLEGSKNPETKRDRSHHQQPKSTLPLPSETTPK